MAQRVAEHVMRTRPWGSRRRLRVDLHGVSVFGPGEHQVLIRWEWVEGIAVEGSGGVAVRSAAEVISLPRGAFGMDPAELAAGLERARSIEHRPDVIGLLSAATP